MPKKKDAVVKVDAEAVADALAVNELETAELAKAKKADMVVK